MSVAVHRLPLAVSSWPIASHGLSSGKIALGVAYALWEGIGILLITLFSVLLFDESLSLLKIAGLTTLVIGIVLIKSGTQKKASSKQEVAHAAV